MFSVGGQSDANTAVNCMSNTNPQGVLESGYNLLWYRIGRVLGRGAFGITYLAEDVNLERPVAIKEYFPSQYCVRDKHGAVSPLSDEAATDYNWGMERFLAEARTLAQFEHPNIVRVMNVFEENGTAFMVMHYEVGTSLSQLLKRRRTLGERDLVQLTVPLLDGLEKIHAEGFIHRDIKPANIYLRTGGSPVLLDFGSARQSMQEQTLTLTSLVSPGFAPIEQYTSKGERQGPWTDIYGFGATLYRAITGVVPLPAVDRSAAISNGNPDQLAAARTLISEPYSEHLLEAIDHALAFRIQDRPQSIAEWRKELELNEAYADTQPELPGERQQSATTEGGGGTERITTAAKPSPVVDTSTAATIQADIDKDATATVKANTPDRKQWYMAAGAAVLAIVVGLGMVFMAPDQVPRDFDTIVADIPADTDLLSQLSADVVPDIINEAIPDMLADDDATASATVATAPADQARINQLLEAARADLAAQRWTSPPGNNAYEKFQAILAINPRHEGARNGMESLLNRYLLLAQQATDEEDFDRAATLLDRAVMVAPGSSQVMRAKVAMEQRRTEVRMRALSDVIEQSETEPATQPAETKASSTDEQIRRRLGGR